MQLQQCENNPKLHSEGHLVNKGLNAIIFRASFTPIKKPFYCNKKQNSYLQYIPQNLNTLYERFMMETKVVESSGKTNI